QANPDGPYVTLLPRQEGRKESRYAHLFCGEPDPGSAPGAGAERGSLTRVETLELEVGELRAALDALEQRFEAFRKQFE
ncbi:MAG: hypothetical protein KDI21_17610, partial [Halieaceae bacterium]|nr:hypothetical protein [Halieaceae bacterium]